MINGDLQLPFAPSLLWYAEWLSHILEGEEETVAINAANSRAGGDGRIFARCLIDSNISAEGTLLGIPVEGGARKLRNLRPGSRILISGHCDWPHIHLGALEATYGKAPYFQSLMPMLREVYDSPSESLFNFNYAIHRALTTFMFEEMTAADLREGLSSPRVIERGKEIAAMLHPQFSLIDSLMRNGRETLMALAAL